MSTLSERAILIRVIIRKWANNKTDRGLSRAIQTDLNADVGTLRLRKTLVDSQEVKALTKLAGHVRNNIVDHLTVPWNEDGSKLLQIGLLDRFESEMNSVMDQWNSHVESLTRNYKNAVEQARKGLGQAFDLSDYPSVHEIIDKYGIEIEYAALPKSGDIRVDLPASQLDKIRSKVESQINKKVENAMRSVHERLTQTLVHLISKLDAFGVDSKTGKATGVFRDSTVNNLNDLIEILPALNVTEDPAMTKITKQLRKQLSGLNPEALRLQEGYRKEVAAKAQKIVKKLEGLF